MCACACEDQKMVINLSELKLQEVVNFLIGVLGTKPDCCALEEQGSLLTTEPSHQSSLILSFSVL